MTASLRYRDMERKRDGETQMEKQRNGETERWKNIGRWRNKEKVIQSDGETEVEKQRNGETEMEKRETDRWNCT